MAQNNTVKVILSIALAAMVGGGFWLIAEVGVKESWTAVANPDDVNAETNATMGGNVSFEERAIFAGAFVTLLGPIGIGAVSVSSRNPTAVNTLVRYGPLLTGFIAWIAVGTEVGNVLSGDYDWDAAATADGYHAFILFCTGAAVSSIAALLQMNRKN